MLRLSRSRLGGRVRQTREFSALFEYSKRKRESCSEHDGKVSDLSITTKRRRLAWSKRDGESRDRHTAVDRISMLPDELLVLILSHLTNEQAAATSVLSHRWRYMWAFTTRLDFDGTKLLLKSDMAIRNPKLAARLNYVRWVNRIIALREDSSTPVEYFRVCFNLTKNYRRSIDKWVRYALERKVRTLELDLTDDFFWRNRRHEWYTFPYKFLSTGNSNCSNYSQPWSLRHCNSIQYKHLKKILLNFVNVNGEALEFFLYNCPLLEDLSVSNSGDLSTLKITGPFLSLRCLEINNCSNLHSVEIRDANLVCLKYFGNKRIHFLLKNVPLLVNFTVGGGILFDIVENVVAMFSSILPQLEIFKIHIPVLTRAEIERLYSAVKLSNLKQLVVRVMGATINRLLTVTTLICASPRLERFVLEASHLRPYDSYDDMGTKILRRSYAHLKEVTFVGYTGRRNDKRLIMHFVNNAIALEKIVIDPRRRFRSSFMRAWTNHFHMEETIEEEMMARAEAEDQLRNKLPKRINLNIL